MGSSPISSISAAVGAPSRFFEIPLDCVSRLSAPASRRPPLPAVFRHLFNCPAVSVALGISVDTKWGKECPLKYGVAPRASLFSPSHTSPALRQHRS